jgi:hypothetical protein
MRTTRSGLVAASLTVLLGSGIALSACGSSSPSATGTTTTTAGNTGSSTTSTSTTTTTQAGGNSSVSQQLSALSGLTGSASSTTFSATYSYKSNGATQTMTIAQSPPKSLFANGSSDFVDTGTATYLCSSGTCLEESTTTDPLSTLTDLFNGTTFDDTATEYAMSASVLATEGVSMSFSGSTYAGLPSKCVTITWTKSGIEPATWCVASSSGVMTSWVDGTNSFTLTAYSSSPPSSDFAIPTGDKITTI